MATDTVQHSTDLGDPAQTGSSQLFLVFDMAMDRVLCCKRSAAFTRSLAAGDGIVEEQM